jgi:hypothetical protein
MEKPFALCERLFLWRGVFALSSLRSARSLHPVRSAAGRSAGTLTPHASNLYGIIMKFARSAAQKVVRTGA